MSLHVVTYRIEGDDRVSAVLQKISSVNTSVKAGVESIKDKLMAAVAPVSNLKARFNALPPVIDKIRAANDKFTNGIKNIPSKIKGSFDWMRRTLGDFGAFITAQFATSAIIGFFGKAKSLAVDLNESINKGRVVFGDFFNDIERYATNADKLSGFSKNAALSYASSFGSMFKELGIHGKDLATLSEGAVRLASDLASFNNLDPGQAFEALFSGIKGETEVLASNFGIVIDEMMVKKKAIDMGLVSKKEAGSALTKEMKVMASYQLVLEKARDAQGDFNRTSDQAANKERILKASVENRLASLGTLFLPLYDKMLTKLQTFMDWVSKNQDQIISWVTKGLKMAAVFLAISTAISVVSRVVTIAKFAMMAFNFVANLNPFAWIPLAIAAVVMLVAYIIKNWDRLRGSFIKWGTFLLKWAVKLNPLSWIANAVKWILNKLEQLFPGIKDRLSVAFTWIIDRLLTLGRLIWKYSPWNLILTGLDYIFPGLKEKLGKVLDWVIDKILAFISWFKKSALGQIISNVFDLKWNSEKPKSKTESKKKVAIAATNETDPYGSTKDILASVGDGSKGAGSAKRGDLGGSVNNISDGVSGGGNLKNINIKIDKLIEKFIIETSNIGMSQQQIQQAVTRTLLSAVNDVNYG